MYKAAASGVQAALYMWAAETGHRYGHITGSSTGDIGEGRKGYRRGLVLLLSAGDENPARLINTTYSTISTPQSADRLSKKKKKKHFPAFLQYE